VPGDPVEILAGEVPTPENLERLRAEFGLDRPLPEQALIYVRNVLTGNLGDSYYRRRPVIELIVERAPATILLMGVQMVIATLLGLVVGVFAARKPYSKLDSIASMVAIMGYCTPVFWLGVMLLYFFSLYLGLLPAGGMVSVRVEMNPFERFFDVLRHLALPALTMGISHLALVFRLTRSSMLEVLSQDFITTARIKGLYERTVLFRHALRNALLPIVTVVGMNAGHMISGALFAETVYAWPGVGRLLYEAIGLRDYPLIMGVFVIVSISVVTFNLITDILCAFLDPRIRSA
jgi:peptide/nickel transport system permease protein